MAYQFNPFTGNFDIAGSGASGTDINGQTEVQSALNDELIIYDTSVSANRKALVRDIGCQGVGGWGITPDRVAPWDVRAPSGSGSAFVTDRIHYLPILFVEQKTFNTVQVVCRASPGGGDVRVGLYDSTNGRPGSLVTDYGKATVSSTGNIQLATNHTIPPGWYWSAFVTNDTGSFSRQLEYPISIIMNFYGVDSDWTFGTITHLYEDVASSAANGLPSTATSSVSKGAGNIPVAVWF